MHSNAACALEIQGITLPTKLVLGLRFRASHFMVVALRVTAASAVPSHSTAAPSVLRTTLQIMRRQVVCQAIAHLFFQGERGLGKD